MSQILILLTLVLLSQSAVSAIIPEISIPSDFNKDRFANYYNDITTAGYGGRRCGYVSFKNFYPPEYTTLKIKRPLFDTWLCLYTVDVTHDGYGPGQVLPEKVYFDKKQEYGKRKSTP
jgi:hypothetical protein